MAYIVETDIFTVHLSGYYLPPLAVFTIFSNTLMCIVLLKKHMRNPTNIILLSITLLDIFTVISVLPASIYYHTLGYYKEYVPYKLCWITFYGRYTVPLILHTASIWLTVVLALQRYICVCHPQVGNRWCTLPSTIRCIIVICISALPINCLNIMRIGFIPLEVPSLLDPTKNITGCSPIIIAVPPDYARTLDTIILWFQCIFVKFIPCLWLLILNSVLIRTMCRAEKRRRMLLSQNRSTESRNLSESNRTTMLLVMVVGLFLVVELPGGVISIMWILENTFNVYIVTVWTTDVVFAITEFLMYLSFPLNLFVYCGMSRQFRGTFKSLFK